MLQNEVNHNENLSLLFQSKQTFSAKDKRLRLIVQSLKTHLYLINILIFIGRVF